MNVVAFATHNNFGHVAGLDGPMKHVASLSSHLDLRGSNALERSLSITAIHAASLIRIQLAASAYSQDVRRCGPKIYICNDSD